MHQPTFAMPKDTQSNTDVEKLNKGIAEVYDESSGIWEDIWGDHMHHGFYDSASDLSLTDHRATQNRMIEEALRFASVSVQRGVCTQLIHGISWDSMMKKLWKSLVIKPIIKSMSSLVLLLIQVDRLKKKLKQYSEWREPAIWDVNNYEKEIAALKSKFYAWDLA